LRVRLTHEVESYSLEEGEPLEIVIRGQRRLLTTDGPEDVPLRVEVRR
jgi:hypothetical protein